MAAVNRNLLVVRGRTVRTDGASGLGVVLRRALAFAVGAALMARAQRRSVIARLMTAAGATLVGRAATGHDDLGRLASWLSPRGGTRTGDVIDDAAEASFPASDPPSWSSGVASVTE